MERERRSRDSDYRDERRDSHRSYRDYRSDRAVSHSESRSQRDDSGLRKDSAKKHLKESYESEQKELDSKRFGRDSHIGEDLYRNTKKSGEQISDDDKESSAKKTKSFGTEYGVFSNIFYTYSFLSFVTQVSFNSLYFPD